MEIIGLLDSNDVSCLPDLPGFGGLRQSAIEAALLRPCFLPIPLRAPLVLKKDETLIPSEEGYFSLFFAK